MASVSSNGAKDFQQSYVLGKTIGNGSTAVIRKCRHKFSRNMYAAKVVKLMDDDKENTVRQAKYEIDLVRKLKHSNVLSFVQVFQTEEKIILITELSENGDLYDFIVNQDQVDEHVSKRFALDISAALNYLHSCKIVHRDIKPENCLLFKSKSDEEYSIKLCDFGLAIYESPRGLTEICGSPSFVAPEILLNVPYDKKVDVWSMGILFYFLLCKRCPFEHEDLNKKFELITNGNLTFSESEWMIVSGEAKELIKKILVKDPKKRLPASDVMYDSWFSSKIPFTPRLMTKKKLSFKGAAIAVATSNAFVANSNRKREDAVLSKELIENVRMVP